MAQVVIAITSGTQWRVPADCKSIQIELIGSGGGYEISTGTCGGGGAYTKLSNFTVTPLQKLTVSMGSSVWISNTGSFPQNTSQGALASGGQLGTAGLASNCIPSTGAFSGGAPGGSALYGGSNYALGGGGGAAGPNGAGGAGGNATATTTGAGGGGGGANGGSAGANAPSATTGGTGGNNRSGGSGSGSGGAGGNSGVTGVAGTQEIIWTDWLGNTYGPGGGSGGSGFDVVNPAGYGGGNTSASNGLIIITYTPETTATTYTEVISTTGTKPWRVPTGVTAVTVQAIGAGSNGNYLNNTTAGGGGAYATVSNISVTSESAVYINVPSATSYGGASQDAWFNTTASSITNAQVVAKGAASGTGGQASACTPITGAYSGGNGGANNTTALSSGRLRGGGGGGAAGPTGAGKNGGAGYNTGTTSGGGGGGGGSNGGSSTAGSAGVNTTTGGAGGNGTDNTGGGSGATSTVAAGSGTVNKGAGGGGGGSGASSINGGSGSTSAIWTITNTTETYGTGGGGGGGGCQTTFAANSFGGSGGTGAGGGGASNISGSGGSGLVVLTYTMANVVAAVTATNNMFLMF
jgi:hypothetical protein